ncbi:unnamed protein product [Fusarium equiseti]|uniref:Chromo domain-containing protein n=1 Tax=Fusarium equiseti TaxID=61235 RepID=A0A8J2INA2_FUSEQ|nr:unnamed protein product [Fusarium equiseti]
MCDAIRRVQAFIPKDQLIGLQRRQRHPHRETEARNGREWTAATLPFPRLLEGYLKAARAEVERRRALQIPPATASNHRYPVNKTVAWRLFDRECVDLLIQWDNGSDDTWEAEEIMHEDMAPLAIQFWRKQGGHEKVTGLRKHQSRAMGDNLEEPQSKCQ